MPDNDEVLRKSRALGVRLTDGEAIAAARRAYARAARFREIRRPRLRSYQRIFRIPFRTIFLDLGFMGKKLRLHNGGSVGFMMAACAHTNTLDAEPFSKRDKDSMYATLTRLLDRGVLGQTMEVLTDGESSLRSPDFRKRLWRERGIRFIVLGSRSKAYLSERAIRHVRTKLSQAMEVEGSKNWTRRLRGILDKHNKARVPGTSFRRVDVDRSTLAEFMEQLYEIPDWHALPGLSRVTDTMLGKKGELAFKFSRGERVLADRRQVGEAGPYPKPSAEGYYSRRVFRVHKRMLATTKDLGLVPSEGGG